MATTYKILAATAGNSSVSWTQAYTVPANTSAVISSVVVANTSTSATNIGIRVYSSAAAFSVYMVPNATGNLAATSRVAFTEGWTLSAGDRIEIIGPANYTVFGSEIA